MNETIEIVRSSRRTLAIEIRPNGQVIVRAPERAAKRDIQRFIDERRGWIEKHLQIVQQRRAERQGLPKFSAGDIRHFAEEARQVIPQRVAHYAPIVGVTYGRITIRSQVSRWGSCSAKGNLNFNCLLTLCPPEVLDYVVVHELCHRKELNHSPRFWAEVERVLPDHRERRKWLRDNGGALIERMRAE